MAENGILFIRLLESPMDQWRDALGRLANT